MTRKIYYGVFLCLLLLSYFPCCANEPKEVWKYIELGKLDGLKVTFQYRPEASLSDKSWLGFTFKNESDKPIKITNAYFRIESKRYTSDGKKGLCSGGLASGNIYDLFGDLKEGKSSSEYLLAPQQEYAVIEHPSDYSSALLELPPKDGVYVEATLYFRLELDNKKRLDTPDEGMNFSFLWKYPSKDGFELMRKRLKTLLKEPVNKVANAYIQGTLLEIRDVPKDLTLDEIFTAIDLRKRSFEGRRSLVEYLSTRRADRQRINDFYLSRLKNKDDRVCNDLLLVALWNPVFIEPLVEFFINNNKKPVFSALHTLSRYYDDWSDNDGIKNRLSKVILDKYGDLLKKHPKELIQSKKLNNWSSCARLLSLSHDKDTIPLLIPFLDCKEQISDPKFASPCAWGEIPRPYRACDIALNAILTILDGESQKGYRKMGIPLVIDKRIGSKYGVHYTFMKMYTVEQMTTWRDEMIVKLKKRLDDMKADNHDINK